MRSSPPVRLDAEVIELLRDSPELLAIADAISATQAAPATRRRMTRVAAVAAMIGVAVALALVSPWSGRGSLVDRALAAIGSGEVIHVVQRADVPGQTLVDLRTGTESPVVRTTELWFDGERGLLRSLQRIGGAVTGEVLETPEGAWTEAGRVYTCAWIAAHPVEATKARVSCNASGENGTTPQQVPEPRPTLDPALAGFVTGYRDALSSGDATRDGRGTLDGRAIEWLRFALPPDTGPARTERVAVDAATYLPVQVETLVGDRLVSRAAVSVSETLDRANVSFARPRLVAPGQEPVINRVVDEAVVSLDEARKALDGKLVGGGASLAGLPIYEITSKTVAIGYGTDSGREPRRAPSVEFSYGETDGNDDLVVGEALEPLMLYRFGLYGQDPPEGSLSVIRLGTRYLGRIRIAGLYVTIEAPSKQLAIDAARALARNAAP